jgi:glucose/arabinose dehydrogenase
MWRSLECEEDAFAGWTWPASSGGRMQPRMSSVSVQKLRDLPTPVRRRIDPADVMVPEGYEVEPVVAGLSFPTALCFDEDGTLYFAEGGSTWPTRPYMPPRIWRIEPGRNPEIVTQENLGGPRGLAVRNGFLYVTLKGGYHMRVVRHDLKSGDRQVIVDKIPSGGWHEPGGPVFGPHDGLMYFAQGSVGLQGVTLPAGYTVDLAKHPHVHDVPGQDVRLSGNTVWGRDPRLPYPFLVQTGPFKPFGTPAEKGEVVKGEKLCNTAVFRSRPDGSDIELLAWGIRNPFGMAFSEVGELYVTDNDFEEKGERSIAEVPDRIWHVENASVPPGQVGDPEWFGYPDFCGDGLPVWHERHKPTRGGLPEPLLEDHPPLAGPAAYLFDPHTGLGKLDFCKSDAFGHRGRAFVCQFGTYAPLNSPREEQVSRGFQVVSVDLSAKTHEPFMRNRHQGPASGTPSSGGLERPVDCKFVPDGRSLYVLDFGNNTASENYVVAYAHTGVLWRIARR